MQEFAGKTAVVTGAANGIGRALADRFAAAGMNVVLADIEEAPLHRAVQELQSQGRRAIGIPVDTMLRASVRDLAARATAQFGNIHLLCNNAGVASRNDASRPVWELPDADWTWVMGVNFWGVLYGLQAFVPGMLAHGEEGHVVNTASMAGMLPADSLYAVSKHAVVALSETLYRDLKTRGARVSASVLCPGMVDTRIVDAERNRPAGLETGAAVDPEKTAMATTAFAGSMPPSEVADHVFAAIREDRFYILTHPGLGRLRAGPGGSRPRPGRAAGPGLRRPGPAESRGGAVLNAAKAELFRECECSQPAPPEEEPDDCQADPRYDGSTRRQR